jgi:DNA polymerase-3 subunit epsilon
MTQFLKNMPVLVLDCQATGANPDRGRLLEVGWAVTSAESHRPEPIQSYLVRSDNEEEVPKRVNRVTGIAMEDLTAPSAITGSKIWTRLIATANRVARANDGQSCPTVIHFCRFEQPYLKKLHHEEAPNIPFPFDIICTHEITKRLLPEIPRRGLRAVAGYFGHSVPELRRSTHHVAATAFVWHHLVQELRKLHGVHTWSRLREWMDATAASQSAGWSYPMERAVRLGLPHEPGVYRMRRSNGDLLYIGKARSLHHRVNSYFQKSRHHGEHTLEMLTQARQVDTTVTQTALEAALLETDEIKRLSPPYNVALRNRDRKIAFSSADLRLTAPEPGEVHRIGPLPSENPLRPLGTFAGIIERGSSETGEELTCLGFSPEHVPEGKCFLSGLEMFQQKHYLRLSHSPALSALLTLGRDLWLGRLEAKEEPSSENDDGEEDDAGAPERGWTPERLVGWLESLALRSTYLIRRSRWLCLLSESSLAWGGKSGDRKALIAFSRGDIFRREELPLNAPIPVPVGCDRSIRERQRAFDILTYDRLVVLTTELRRLLAEGRRVELRLSQRSTLRNNEIARALRWV